ncbi:hypothetical protein K461DRAFT_290551 [Myriangium duriaei CBS 260.36]|uniref:Xylanolytic transcriptional activator regulatory domain-containing protein n=1 Tax=Myriangium duriaei CBS 260.36 TaxID=1168546 RepID=A0A9P4J637_9PEZI|nr:hypothetical protein K461DRAFT_290551 [Myriangium duriaei CBS 260.36]
MTRESQSYSREATREECELADRFRLTLRFAIDLLTNRIEELYSFMTQHDLDVPEMKVQQRQALAQVFKHLRIEKYFSRISTPSKQPQSGPSLGQHTQKEDLSFLGPLRLDVHGSGSNPMIYDGTFDWECNTPSGLYDEEPNVDSGTAGLAVGLDQTVKRHNARANCATGLDLSNQPSNILEKSPIHDQARNLPDESISSVPSFPPTELAVTSNHCSGVEYNPVAEDENEGLLDQLSERMGSLQIGPGGQIRYYGPTSINANFKFVDMPISDDLTIHRTVRQDCQDYLDRLDMGKEVPSVLEEHLTNLYFAWQDPTYHIVDRPIYEAAKVQWRERKDSTQYFSEALLNSICCLGAAFEARYHPTFTTFPKSLSDFFADRAKALLEIELDCPSVATVQAMSVLSPHDIGCKREARGWLYSGGTCLFGRRDYDIDSDIGMAMRLAFDLALHVDMSQYVAQGTLTQKEADLRRDVFWGVYVVDHILGLYLGRPFRINMEDVTVSKPYSSTLQHPNMAQDWFPYASSEPSSSFPPMSDPVELLQLQRVSLVELMEPLSYGLYSRINIDRHSLQAMNAEVVTKMLSWKSRLPSVLHVDIDDYQTAYLPHVLLLHMQYYQYMIYAHRPWMSRSYIQPTNPPQGPGSDHARTICIESAFAIAKLLQLYETRYALRQVNIQAVGMTCSAALLLIFATVSKYDCPSNHDLPTQLSTCFRALDEFAAPWESAKRAKEFLVLLQRRWQRRGPAGKARCASDASLAESVPAKRHRMSDDMSTGASSLEPQVKDVLLSTSSSELDLELDLDWIFTSDGLEMFQGL